MVKKVEAPKAKNIKKAPKNKAVTKAGVKKVPKTKVNPKTEAPKAKAIPKVAKKAAKKVGKVPAATLAKKAAGKRLSAMKNLHWFDKLSKTAQAEYIKAHPNSKLAKGSKKAFKDKINSVAKKAMTAKPKKDSTTVAAIGRDVRMAERKHAAAKKAVEAHKKTTRSKNNVGSWDKKLTTLKTNLSTAKNAVTFHKHKAKLAAKLAK